MRALLEAVEEGITVQLKKLDLDLISSIESILISRAVLKVQEVEITGGQSAQLQAILTGIQASTNTGLKSLDLGSASLTQVSPDILAGAAVKLEIFRAILNRSASTQNSKLITGVDGRPQQRESPPPDICLQTVEPTHHKYRQSFTLV